MSDNLESQINQQIKALEALQKKLTKKVNLERELTQFSDEFIQPDFDMSERYEDNMAAFFKFYPDIFHSFNNYTLKRYELTFENQQLNIFDTKDKKYLYKDNVFKSSFLQCKRFYKDPQLFQQAFDERQDDIDRFIHTKHLAKLTSFLNSIQRNNDKLPTIISSMMFFGVGAGCHIHQVVQNHKIKNMFIYEPSLDLFYLSLYLNDWNDILNKLDMDGGQLHFSLGKPESNKNLVNEVSGLFFKIGRFHSARSYIYVHYLEKDLLESVSEVSKSFDLNLLGLGFFDDALMSIGHFQNNLKNKIKLLKNKKLEMLSNIPVFVVANGPSLDEDIDFLRNNKDKSIIISCGTAIGALYKYGIKPDYHCEMERCLITRTVLDIIDDKSYFKGITLLALNTVHPSVFELFDNSVQAIKLGEAGSTLHQQNPDVEPGDYAVLSYCNPTVTNCALSFCESMGMDKVFLFGVDMGYVGDKHHSKKSIYYDQNDKEQDRDLYKIDNTISVKGNFVEEVKTDSIYNYSRRVIESFLAAKPHLNVINCSNGAKISGAMPTHSDDISFSEILNKKLLIELINNNLFIDPEDSTLDFFDEVILENKHHFIDLCDFFIEQLSANPKSVDDTIEVLESQLDRLKSFSASKFSVFDDLLRGSLLHSHSVLLHVLYSSNDEQESLSNYAAASKYTIDYIKDMKGEFLINPYKIDIIDDADVWIE
ncbi:MULTISPECIES: 6-hydroxymethylpterin diphosphokinase MptE-like protein [Pseudoalteromonas]|uniref:motility associated factor glycosyltransferase family protein n=2 Tax=Bacteria TaxID=2 RepID=UPI00110CAF43|nr:MULTISPECIES: 6-hydroxymethylpterin diphosphokinase MptE-like protein [Pseudoalteromonas]TMS81872.1 hypothetical protein CWB65_08365 [Pseudoalteromonas sp. S554]